ncbi:uncharacterized protein LOC106053573 [Biomphalaria glabrata]|uniref:Uncharacterized protein LOC106053573 n=1 Tax=Biomphalaria glabrata TaxID=6526 RepID=A0A9U8DXQ5_BIOGL|nr:uncharacterized protein LOC106053573 [Biomphalaria glabrata]
MSLRFALRVCKLFQPSRMPRCFNKTTNINILKLDILSQNNLHKLFNSRQTFCTGLPQKEKISSFPIPDASQLPEDLQKLMENAKEKGGFIPNVFQALSHRPEELRAFVKFYDAIMEDRNGGHLTKADKEMIVVAVSSYNKCRYCIIAHSALFRIYSKNKLLADQVAANWETADLDERQKAILQFAMKVTKCEALSEKDFETLTQHGLDREDAWDIGSVVAFFSLSNRMAYLTSMVPNEEFYLLGRVPKQKK